MFPTQLTINLTGSTVERSNRLNNSRGLVIDTKTWRKDSHDLFDFEASNENLAADRILMSDSADIFRRQHELMARPRDGMIPYGSELLCHIDIDSDNKVSVSAPLKRNGAAKEPCKVLRVVHQDKYCRLKPGDIIKLGRYKIRVRQIEVEGTAQPDLSLENTASNTTSTSPTPYDPLKTCRICLLEGGDQEDPLIDPCECKGSIQYVHLNCVRHWMEGRLCLADKLKNVYFYKQLQCELCKKDYSGNFVVDGQKDALVQFPTLNPPYIVLENLTRDNRDPPTEVVDPCDRVKSLYILAYDENTSEIKIGRGHEAGVRISDVSITRCHAMLAFKDNHFCLIDNKSKFGTSLEISGRADITGSLDELDEKRGNLPEYLTLQVGRTILSICYAHRLLNNAPERHSSTERSSTASPRTVNDGE